MDKLITILLGLVLAGTIVMSVSIFSGLNDGRVETVVKQLVKGAK